MPIATHHLDHPLQISILFTLGDTHILPQNRDLYLCILVYILNRPLRISYFSSLTSDGIWNETIDTCINIGDLDMNSRIEIKVMDAIEDVCVLRTVLNCFEQGVLKQGRQYCLLLPSQSKRMITLPQTLQYQLSQSTDPLVLENLKTFGEKVCALYLIVSLPVFDYKHIIYTEKIYSAVSDAPKADVKDFVNLHKLCQKPVTWAMTINERNLVWRHRGELARIPKSLVKFIQSLDWDDKEDIKEAYNLLNTLDADESQTLDILYLVQMLLEKGDQIDRRMWPIIAAHLDLFSNLHLFAPQLCDLAIVKPGTPSWLAENIGDWLVGRAKTDAVFAQRLFWYAKIAALHGSQQTGTTATVAGHSIFLQALPRNEMYKQQEELIKRLVLTLNAVKNNKLMRLQQTELIKRKLREQPVVNQPGIYLPLDDEHRHPIEGLLTEDTLVFKSKAMPVRLTFLTPCGVFPVPTSSIIFRLFSKRERI